MANAQERLNELVAEYGTDRVVGWVESRLKQLARNKDPEFRTKQRDRQKKQREAHKSEIEQLQAQLAELKQKAQTAGISV